METNLLHLLVLTCALSLQYRTVARLTHINVYLPTGTLRPRIYARWPKKLSTQVNLHFKIQQQHEDSIRIPRPLIRRLGHLQPNLVCQS